VSVLRGELWRCDVVDAGDVSGTRAAGAGGFGLDSSLDSGCCLGKTSV
jgi:hypothetical protein